ncbi:hypothetical protein C922_00715 [Plasmodium inui San Antonio 1]|uniref:Male development gene 1 n=1 Tax=Plasmodium inui San Antonio 1 TaxID=1237626 RepID=W7AJN0_9APIC|nr:hypothetical protein C922_00715 [Plasmodium inui San Antonio 1]EUD69024.1 hypothetical protein C922_00715 [Plasmodium inui San Antonio 1]
MKNIAFSVLNISSLFILYLSSQSGLYNCMKAEQRATTSTRSKTNSAVNDNILSTEWSQHGYTFTDLVKNGYLTNKEDLDEVKDNLADELAEKIKDKLNDFLKDGKIFYDLEDMDDENVSHFKNYLRNICEYIVLKTADILNANIEDALNPLMSKSSFASLKESMENSGPLDLEFDEDDETEAKSTKGNSNGELIDEEAEDFIDELVEGYEDKQHKDLEEYVQEIKTHDDLD